MIANVAYIKIKVSENLTLRDNMRDIRDMTLESISNIRGMFEKNCLFLSGDFKFQVSPKVLIPCHQRTLRG